MTGAVTRTSAARRRAERQRQEKEAGSLAPDLETHRVEEPVEEASWEHPPLAGLHWDERVRTDPTDLLRPSNREEDSGPRGV